MPLDSFVYQACGILTQDMERLRPLVLKLKEAASLEEKNEIISKEPLVEDCLTRSSLLSSYMSSLPLDRAFALKALIAIDQAQGVLDMQGLWDGELESRLFSLIDCLLTVETFYHEFGGIVGYHLAMIELLCRPEERVYGREAKYLAPDLIPIEEATYEVKQSILHYIDHMEELAEMYPVGGTADRLRLLDPITGQPLPAASLHFCGKTLLERLIDDVQAKEYVYYKLKGKQITLPIAMMTSKEKDNHERILSFCKGREFFHRGEENFFFFCQPSVPTINSEGKWAMQGQLKLLLRPGGHGVIWKLARDSGCFDWLQNRGVKKLLVRQINNPIAGEDFGLFAFSGFGLKYDMALGFCSCPRIVGSAEGTNVLVEERKGDAFEYTLTNIEYCDFAKYGIADQPIDSGSSFSKYPSNTNILLVDLLSLKEALSDRPIPGMLVNLKKISFKDEDGVIREEPLARLESMMQNIADSFTESFSTQKDEKPLPLRTYITYNQRRKTISTTKKEFSLGASLIETPEGCFVDMMHNAKELLSSCQIAVCDKNKSHMPVTVLYHPALGPMYSIISQKVSCGVIAAGSELEMQIAEVDVKGLTLDGSLKVVAENITGHVNEDKRLENSLCTGKCTLWNVQVLNEGIDYMQPSVMWKGDYVRRECLSIHIKGSGEFFAEDVCFKGDFSIQVPDGVRMIACQQGDDVVFIEEKISEPSWHWSYAVGNDADIVLTRKK